MNYEFSLFHRNFVMAVSYGVTFAVMVVFLFIAFTGYLEVNKPRRAVFNTYQQVIHLLSTVQVSVSVFKWRENTRTCTCGMNGPGSGLTDGSRGTHRSFCTFSPAFFIFNTRQKQRKQWKPNHAHPNLIPTLAETHLTRLCPSPQSVSAQEYPFTFTECYQRYHLTLTLKRAAI